MVMVTTRFNRKRAVAALIALGAALIVLVLLFGRRSEANSPTSKIVRSNNDRVEYLENLGWSVEENAIEEQTVTIPRELDGVYKRYNEIQTAQGFDLSTYGGAEAVRYTYRIRNFPGGDDSAVADIIVYRNEIIAGDVQSARLDGFMQGLSYPEIK
ncbi:MAG: DUF4830 domain-containing protein [Oscillospiraceae bacterium]|jgi:hypothetical protein|nr:DUF4830 domain-containing protein [Oscillospiraceae bacterium]